MGYKIYSEGSMKRVLITGITGFTGSHLSEYCLNKGYEVYGLTRGRYHQYSFIEHIMNDIKLIEGDLSDYHSVLSCITDVNPDYIFHLGAISSVPLSWKAPQSTFNTNTTGTLNVLEALRMSKSNAKILNVGTSEEYGLVYKDEIPIKETNPLRPLSPYAVSKIASDFLGYQYYKSYGLKVIRVRPFNIVGTRGGKEIITANFALQLSRIRNGKHDRELNMGNYSSIRDFNDVRDIVKAYDIAMDRCDYGELYNICTGDGITIKDLALKMINLSNLENIKLNIDQSRFRPSDVDNLIGDSTKFREKTGWKPDIPLDKSLVDVLNYWNDRT
jgi:GDP-4-dehydro-6-deoxy-D-mannose reductase